jgi:plasmid maintenance system antidote protein VapI
MCPSSGELNVSIRHLVYVTVCRWPFGVQVWMKLQSSFSCMFISVLYTFRPAMCPSSGELNVSIRHLVYVTVYRWSFGVQVWMKLQSSFSCMFISNLYMFRATMCPSSGELIVSIRHQVYVTLYSWPFGVQVWMRLQSHSNLHTKRSSIQSDIHQMSYWYNWFSWWWAHTYLLHGAESFLRS